MTCSCPKCNAPIAIEPAEILSEGSFNKCSECSTSFAVSKVSFARRALHKADEISCAECGSRPGSSIYCQNCHAIYPDFLVIATSSAAKKQFSKLLATFNIFRKRTSGLTANTHHDPFTPAAKTATKSKGLSLPGQPAQLAALLAAIVIFSAGGGYYWYQNKLATEYTEHYVRALMGIKTARDFELKISGRLSTEMKSGSLTALTPAEKKSVNSAKNDVDTLVKRIGKAPEKFEASNDAMAKLYESYSNLHSTVTLPAGMSDTYSAAVKKSDEEFMNSAKELKARLHEKIAAQLAESRKKYKQLQDF